VKPRQPEQHPVAPLKIYCEVGALSAEIRAMQRQGLVELMNFPYDPDLRTKKIPSLAVPSEAQIRDLNLRICELPGTIADYSGSNLLAGILDIIGTQHRRDALHVDSAVKSGCSAFMTRDRDILDHRAALESLTGIRFFHPDADVEALRGFVATAGPPA